MECSCRISRWLFVSLLAVPRRRVSFGAEVIHTRGLANGAPTASHRSAVNWKITQWDRDSLGKQPSFSLLFTLDVYLGRDYSKRTRSKRREGRVGGMSAV